MERIPFDTEVSDLLVRDLDAQRIEIRIDLRTHLQARLGGGSRDEIDDDLMADQRLASPVLTDEREQPVFDLVPFTGAGRQMAN